MNIPNLPPLSPAIDENGYRTPVEQIFIQQLITELQRNAGNEGLVMATVNPTQLATIQNNQLENGQFTCQLGTMLYVIVDPNDYTQDKAVIAVRNSNDYPLSAPLFKTFTLT